MVMVHSVFSVLYPLQQEENIVMFDGQSDVDVAGLHEDETFNIWIMFTYGRSNFGCSRKRKTRSSGLRRLEAQSISYMTTFLRQVFGDFFSAQVPQRQMGNESRR